MELSSSKKLSMLLAVVLSLGQLAASPPESTRIKQSKSQKVQAAAETQKAAEPLSEEETADLVQRDEEPAREVAGGALTNQTLTYIVIALAAAVIVLIAVH